MRAIGPVPGDVPMWLVFEKLPGNAPATFLACSVRSIRASDAKAHGSDHPQDQHCYTGRDGEDSKHGPPGLGLAPHASTARRIPMMFRGLRCPVALAGAAKA